METGAADPTSASSPTIGGRQGRRQSPPGPQILLDVAALAVRPLPGQDIRVGLPLTTGMVDAGMVAEDSVLVFLPMGRRDGERDKIWGASAETWLCRNYAQLARKRRMTHWYPCWLTARDQRIQDFHNPDSASARPHYVVELNFLVVVGSSR